MSLSHHLAIGVTRTMNVPFIDLARLTKSMKSEVLADWSAVFDKTEFVGGPRVGALEKALCADLGVDRTIACANGTDALVIGLQAMGVKAGTKVAIPNMTFWATYEAVAQLGGIPVLIDIDPNDLQMSLPEFLCAYEAYRFDAAVLVHLFGWASPKLADFRKFCAEKNIALLEDGAQCYGVKINGVPVLKGSTVGTTSFYPAKVVGGCVDGGAIFANSEALEKLIRSLCNHGRSAHYSYERNGWNSRMGGLQAAFLNHVVARSGEIVADRRRSAEWYRKRLAGTDKLNIFAPPAGQDENGYLAVFTVADGVDVNAVTDGLKARGIGFGRTYPETMDSQPPAVDAIKVGTLQHSRKFCKSALNLPLFFGITEPELEACASALQEVLRGL
ncbi:MAG: DegT/DnrJ/EryC1/StrS family aminotransferase [Deltaproteobacteria bacterium]|nr:DegT/DnrJ/EryC1/StrS family aminotransferase [Deltaproteobacteria bacterium]